MRAEELDPYVGGYVRITLVDGTRKRGFVSDVGYQGITLMRRGIPCLWRASHIKSIRKVRKFL